MLDLYRNPQKSKYWYARGTINGRRIERSTGETSKSKARARLTQITADEEGRIDLATIPWQKRTFAQGVSDYIDGGGELRFLDKPLAHFGETLLGNIDQSAMDRASAVLYPNASPATIRRNLFVPVNAVINKAKSDKLKPPKGDNQRTVWLWPNQVEDLIRVSTNNRNTMMPAMITGLVGAGFRTSELFSIDAQRDLQLGNSFTRLQTSKNTDAREVHLISRVVAAWSLLPTVGMPGALFRRVDGQPYQKRTGRGGQIRLPFAWCVERAGLDPETITPHVLRHTWATWFYAVTNNTQWLKQQGGWRSKEYDRYTKAAPARLKDEVLAHGWDFREVLGENRGSGKANAVKTMA